MEVLEIKAKNFILGESSSDYVNDRGFSPDSYGLNLTKERGVLYFAPSPTDIGGATLTGNIVASCYDPSYLGNDIYHIDDEGAFYSLDSATLTKEQTSLHSYTLGTTDIIHFLGKIYATHQLGVVQLEYDMSAISDEWWSGLDSSYRHPMERVEGELFIANKNVIYYWNGTSSGTAFTLPTDVNVTTMRKHTDGRTLLAFTGNEASFSHLSGGGGKVYYCDPVLRDWTREVEIESQVEGTRLVGGIIYCTWGDDFGYFDGNGLTSLKKFTTSTTTYSHCMGNMEDILLFRDGENVVAFGDLGAGRVFWKPYNNTTNSNHINNIIYKGDNKLLVAFQGASAGTGLLKEIDYDSAGVNGIFYTNRETFGSEVEIKKIELVHDKSDSAGTTQFLVRHRDTEDVESTVETVSYTNQEVSKTRIQSDIKTDFMQLKIEPFSDDIGFKLIRINYDGI